jgi:hypothetical protein
LPDTETGEITERWTYTLITRNANEVMLQIHNDGDNKGRMPLFLPFEMSKKWVEEELTEDQFREILAFEMPSDELAYHPVFTIRSPKGRPDNKSEIDFWEWEKLPALGEMNPD